MLQQKQPNAALELIDALLKELKKLDDKQMLTEAHLTESRIYHSLQNIPKCEFICLSLSFSLLIASDVFHLLTFVFMFAFFRDLAKASLTASRTAANSIYVVPLLQAELDEMSGILHCEESDYTTAYSYFLEAYDAYDQAPNHATSAVNCLKYMILCKILNEAASEVPSLLSSKIGMKHSGIDLEAMATIAKAAKIRSLEDFTASVSISLSVAPFLHFLSGINFLRLRNTMRT